MKHSVLPSLRVEHLSAFILALNIANASHVAVLLLFEGSLLFASPLYASFVLSRVLLGLFTQEVHLHVLLSSAVTILGLCCSQFSSLLAIITCLLLELTAVVILSGGPCSHEEAIVHLAQCRLQHQLTRSQASQRLDVAREELSGQLLAIATEGIAELTASVQHASEPVLNMLKSSCATGTKSASEAERIGRIGEALQAEVADLLRFKTSTTWERLQERARTRLQQLQRDAQAQQAASDAMLRSVHQGIGRSLAEIHKLEMEAEASMAQIVQSEVNRAMEIADARMDLVRQSAQAMERRVSDTVEVLLSLLKYFRSKGSYGEHVATARARPRQGPTEDASRPLPVICEVGKVKTAQPQIPEEPEEGSGLPNPAEPWLAEETRPLLNGRRLLIPRRRAVPEGGQDDSASRSSSSASSSREEPREANPEKTSSADPANEGHQPNQSAPGPRTPSTQSEAAWSRGGVCVPRAMMERHPLFATRLCYRSEDFFFSWASSADFRAEADALRQWRRTMTLSAERSGVTGASPSTSHAEPEEARPHGSGFIGTESSEDTGRSNPSSDAD
ncbi:unnamed protein product [Symbiodinium natans]|uniref:Uncharacterized protein n=1 Tax=Symbiodinium natans TaxID=878477 RepID=A0A812K5J7_9DINO|nr:unnamed protein product [Symbiodinium natans]